MNKLQRQRSIPFPPSVAVKSAAIHDSREHKLQGLGPVRREQWTRVAVLSTEFFLWAINVSQQSAIGGSTRKLLCQASAVHQLLACKGAIERREEGWTPSQRTSLD